MTQTETGAGDRESVPARGGRASDARPLGVFRLNRL